MSLPRRSMGWSVIVSFSGPTHLFLSNIQDIGSCVHIILDSFAYTLYITYIKYGGTDHLILYLIERPLDDFCKQSRPSLDSSFTRAA